ncbi:hypothetical protein HPP92_028725 [Vanilla planifolia]|uniref:Uncharacterized protein n=1 Tax=Vanilla planifolia TaxID=51239 RepID=A0A835P6C9_VANPL|nr:hypothetical protein HPP92_028725 [Vanilla planifolia]
MRGETPSCLLGAQWKPVLCLSILSRRGYTGSRHRSSFIKTGFLCNFIQLLGFLTDSFIEVDKLPCLFCQPPTVTAYEALRCGCIMLLCRRFPFPLPLMTMEVISFGVATVR